NHALRRARAGLMAEERRRADNVVQETTHRFDELVKTEAKLRESERRYRSIFETAGVSIWEEDFSQVKVAIDGLKARGVGDVRAYLDGHPEFVEQAIPMVRIVDVNPATVSLFGALSKEELLVSLHAIFTTETQRVFAGELAAVAEGQAFF